MKLQLNIDDLESQWKTREIDLYPWFDGLFALLRSREAMIKETEKRLSVSTPATMVQFLSSDDRDNVKIAHAIIKGQAPESILPILLYSLEKTTKPNYYLRVMESLLDFDPELSFGYLLGYVNERKEQKETILKIFMAIVSNFKDTYSTTDDKGFFLDKLFEAIGADLKERIPTHKTINSLQDFNEINLDLFIMEMIYSQIYPMDTILSQVEEEMRSIGKEHIRSLSSIPLTSVDLMEQKYLVLKDMIVFMTLMRLESDLKFLRKINDILVNLGFNEDSRGEIEQKAQVAIEVITHPEKTIKEILRGEDPSVFIF